jgi:hypothetical protein
LWVLRLTRARSPIGRSAPPMAARSTAAPTARPRPAVVGSVRRAHPRAPPGAARTFDAGEALVRIARRKAPASVRSPRPRRRERVWRDPNRSSGGGATELAAAPVAQPRVAPGTRSFASSRPTRARPPAPRARLTCGAAAARRASARGKVPERCRLLSSFKTGDAVAGHEPMRANRAGARGSRRYRPPRWLRVRETWPPGALSVRRVQPRAPAGAASVFDASEARLTKPRLRLQIQALRKGRWAGPGRDIECIMSWICQD